MPWTWIKIDNRVDEHERVYGTQGVANDQINPALLCHVSWTDATATLGYSADCFTGTEFGYRNDLWKYNRGHQSMDMIKGNNASTSGVYGTKGTAHINNKPGGRYCNRTWTDNNGKSLLFGDMFLITNHPALSMIFGNTILLL
jgi:hypothetical protein